MTSTREDLSASLDKTGTALRDHGQHVVDVGRKQAESALKIGRQQAEAAAKLGRERAESGAKAGRKQAEAAAKKARRQTRVAAKQARKRSAEVWADFADEASHRAANVLAAGRGEAVVAPRRRRAPLILGAAAGLVAMLVVLRARSARVLQPVPVVPTDLPAAPDIAASTETRTGPDSTVSRARHLG